ncbi:MAG: DUF58 domain-containing protein [Candidatus Woesearchaeota archaeon]
MGALNLDFTHYIRHLKYYINKREFAVGPRGNYLSYYKGDSTDFYGFRQYNPDDDASAIDWKASARTDKLMVREFIQEKGLHFIVMLDTSGSMFFTSSEKLKCEYAAEVAGAISFSVAYTGNSMGLCVFNNGVIRMLEPKRGMSQYYQILNTLKDESFYGGEKDYHASFSYLLRAIKRHTIIYIISDFVDFGLGNEEIISSMTGKFEVIGIMVRDTAEYDLPKKGNICIADPKTGESILVNSSEISEEYSYEAKKQEEEIVETFLRNNLFFHSMYTNEDINDALTKIYALRSR